MVEICRKISEARWFHNFIIGVILSAGIVVGLETYPAIMSQQGELLHMLDKIILYIFVAEILIKMSAKIPKPWEYFYDGWNVFDFIIIAVCFFADWRRIYCCASSCKDTGECSVLSAHCQSCSCLSELY